MWPEDDAYDKHDPWAVPALTIAAPLPGAMVELGINVGFGAEPECQELALLPRRTSSDFGASRPVEVNRP
jgi:hypothetical protein